MTVEIIFGDGIKLLETSCTMRVDAIITDPPYDAQYIGYPDMLRICTGNVIAFCDPARRYFVPDEIAYWVKPTSTKNYSRHIGRFVEEILITRRGDTFNDGLYWANYIGVYTDLLLEKQVHPYQKPLALIERLIAIYTNPGDTILDPFAGSGTTLVAAARMGRNCIGCENDEDYFQAAAERIAPLAAMTLNGK